jgi:ubiquinone/menaquinone biosynthesis C-methylase UbiE
MGDGAARWEKAANAYATGEHKSGRELELVIAFAGPSGTERALDVGAGAGHTALALAPHVESVVVTDPVDGMLVAARRVFAEAGLTNAEFVIAVAERLPFADASFDIVTTRLAAHHFDDVPGAMREIARVLRPGGRFIFIDTMAPADATAARWQDEVEALRDATHRHLYPQQEWIAFVVAGGFDVEQIEVVRKTHPFEAWLERGGQDLAIMQRVHEAFLQAPASAVRALDIATADGRVLSFTDSKLVLAARRSA